jgi:hypothetical protein
MVPGTNLAKKETIAMYDPAKMTKAEIKAEMERLYALRETQCCGDPDHDDTFQRLQKLRVMLNQIPD